MLSKIEHEITEVQKCLMGQREVLSHLYEVLDLPEPPQKDDAGIAGNKADARLGRIRDNVKYLQETVINNTSMLMQLRSHLTEHEGERAVQDKSP